MSALTVPMAWAKETFGGCDLGSRRRTARLASNLAQHTGQSLLGACAGDEAAAEGM